MTEQERKEIQERAEAYYEGRELYYKHRLEKFMDCDIYMVLSIAIGFLLLMVIIL